MRSASIRRCMPPPWEPAAPAVGSSRHGRGSTGLRVVKPVKGTSRFRQDWMFGFRFLGLRRELQYGRALAFAKMREQHDLAVGKLQRIMVGAEVVHVHLPESCDQVRQRSGPPEQKREACEMALDLILKGDLGARKKADGYPWFFRRGKAACGCIPELRRDQLVPDLRGPRRDAVQAVVAPGKELRFVLRPCNPDRC